MSEIPAYDEALRMPARKAEEGSVTAIVALERPLRPRREEEAGDEVHDALDRILAGD
jgi:hypothetical protein